MDCEEVEFACSDYPSNATAAFLSIKVPCSTCFVMVTKVFILFFVLHRCLGKLEFLLLLFCR